MHSTSTDLFWKKVKKTSRCWMWLGGKGGDGYGKVKRRGRTYRAHRLAWILTYGADADGVLRHKCDVPLCVNPQHLEIGTPADNSRDMTERRRQAWGERHGSAVLSATAVQQVRVLLREGLLNGVQIGERFGVSKTAISRIRRGRTWRLLETEEVNNA